MIDYQEILKLAHDLIESRPVDHPSMAYTDKPLQALLRRSVSASYYGLFSYVCNRGADLLAGEDATDTPRWVTIYRSYSHNFMKEACGKILAQPKVSRYLPPPPPNPPGAMIFARHFRATQEWRHGVDYDPLFKASFNTAYSQHARALEAIAAFESLNTSEQTNLIVRLMLKDRGN